MLNLVLTSLQQCWKYKQTYKQHLVTQYKVVQNSSGLQNLKMAECQLRMMKEIIIHQSPKMLQHSNMYRILILCILWHHVLHYPFLYQLSCSTPRFITHVLVLGPMHFGLY